MAMGYSRSRMLCAAARLGLADALDDEPRSVDQLAAMCDAHPSSLYRLLRALASFGIVVETTPRHFILTSIGKPLRKDVAQFRMGSGCILGGPARRQLVLSDRMRPHR